MAAPLKFVAQLPQLVKPGGVLVLASPYVWSEQWTPKKVNRFAKDFGGRGARHVCWYNVAAHGRVGARHATCKRAFMVFYAPMQCLIAYPVGLALQEWVGGFVNKAGEPVWSGEQLKGLLGEEFQCVEQQEVLCVVRESARCFTVLKLHCLVFLREAGAT
jgi:hypothetical protein